MCLLHLMNYPQLVMLRPVGCFEWVQPSVLEAGLLKSGPARCVCVLVVNTKSERSCWIHFDGMRSCVSSVGSGVGVCLYCSVVLHVLPDPQLC